MGGSAARTQPNCLRVSRAAALSVLRQALPGGGERPTSGASSPSEAQCSRCVDHLHAVAARRAARELPFRVPDPPHPSSAEHCTRALLLLREGHGRADALHGGPLAAGPPPLRRLVARWVQSPVRPSTTGTSCCVKMSATSVRTSIELQRMSGPSSGSSQPSCAPKRRATVTRRGARRHDISLHDTPSLDRTPACRTPRDGDTEQWSRRSLS